MDFSAPSTSKKPKPERGPVLRHGATPLEAQRHALQKLLKDPSKPVHIPEPPPEGVKSLRDPRDMMKNVQGSSAGAGSGEFHVYKQSRRREYERLKLMDEEEEYNKNKNDAEQRQLEYLTTAEQRTAKNRLKRQRKKAGRSKGKPSGGSDDEEKEEPILEGEGKKRRLGGGAVMKFKTAEERELEGELGEEEVRRVEVEEEVARAEEAGILIRDDD